MRSTGTLFLLAAALAANTAIANAGVTARIGGSIGGAVSATAGMPGASLSIAAPATIGLGANALDSTQNAGGSARAGFGVSPNVAMQTATVRTLGSGTVTFMTQSGAVMTVPMSDAQVRMLGLRSGTNLALTRTARGIVVTNLDYVHALTGRGIVRRIASNAVTFTNRTGTHTIGLAHYAISRLRLHRGSQIMVSTRNVTEVAVSLVAQPGR